MRRFTFKLDPVLAHRAAVERDHQRRVAEIERQRLGLEQELRRHQQELREARGDLRGRLCGTLHAGDLRLQAAAALQQMRRAQSIAVELAALHQRMEAARRALVEASRRRRTLELLRERRLARWRAGEAKAAQQALDELAAQQHGGAIGMEADE